MTEYTTPDILLDADENDILKRMVADIPHDIDVAEGSVAYDLLHPTAVEIERLKQFDLDYLYQQIWPQFAEGEALDYHGEARGLTRKTATAASGTLTVRGEPNTPIYDGDLFATEGIGTVPSMSYAANGDYLVQSTGYVDISVTCTETGVGGNAAARSVIIVESAEDGIESCINENPMTGGSDEESDEAYRERILDFDQAKEASYTGSMADYRRWANEVPGVGSVLVVPANNTYGLVQLVITDSNGELPSQELLETVYNHIMRPDNPYERLAPINAHIDVVSPTNTPIYVTAIIELDGVSISQVKTAFLNDVRSYFKTAITEGKIRYQKVANILGDIAGVYDFTVFKLNGDEANIELGDGEFPTIQDSDVHFVDSSEVKTAYVYVISNLQPTVVTVEGFSYSAQEGIIFTDSQYTSYLELTANQIISLEPLKLSTAPNLEVLAEYTNTFFNIGIRNTRGQAQTWPAGEPVVLVKYSGEGTVHPISTP